MFIKSAGLKQVATMSFNWQQNIS